MTEVEALKPLYVAYAAYEPGEPHDSSNCPGCKAQYSQPSYSLSGSLEYQEYMYYKKRAEVLNDRYRFERPERPHPDSREAILKKVTAVMKEDPDREKNTRAYRKILEAIMYEEQALIAPNYLPEIYGKDFNFKAYPNFDILPVISKPTSAVTITGV